MTYRHLGAVGTFPYPIIDSVITGIIVRIKHGNGAPGTLAQFDSGFELVIDAGDDGLFVLTAKNQGVRGKNLAQAKLGRTSLCPRVQAALIRADKCQT